MSQSPTLTTITPYPFLRRNYWAHNIEGAFFMGALPFISLEIVMPKLVETLGGNSLLISLTPVAMMLGFMTPPMLLAHLVERLDHYKPICLITGIIQRGVFGIAGVILYWFADDFPTLGLWAVVFIPYLSGFAGGVSMTAWTELVAKVIPIKKLSSSSAIRNISGGLIGFAAGYIIKYILEHSTGYKGYGILFFITFFLTMMSYLLFTQIKEPPTQRLTKPHHKTLWSNLKSLPKFFREQVVLRRFIVMGFLSTGMFIILPFMGIHALQASGQPNSFLGELVSFQMAGALGGNLLGGYLGDKFGSKIVLVLARLLLITVALLMIFNTDTWGFRLLFALHGFAYWLNQIGRMTMNIEICPADIRPTFIATMSMVLGAGMLMASIISAIAHKLTGQFYPAAIASIILLSLSMIWLLRIKEPRTTISSP